MNYIGIYTQKEAPKGKLVKKRDRERELIKALIKRSVKLGETFVHKTRQDKGMAWLSNRNLVQIHNSVVTTPIIDYVLISDSQKNSHTVRESDKLIGNMH